MTTDPSPLPEGVTPADVLAEVRRCAASWDGDACLVGNVRAGAIVVAIDRLAEEVQRLKAEREKAIQAVVDACEKHVGHVEAELAAAEARVAELEATIGKYEHVYVMTGTGQSDG